MKDLLNKYNVDFLRNVKIDKESEVSTPARIIGEITKLYDRMEEGDSFLIDDYDDFNSIRARMSFISKKRKDGFKIVTRQVEDGYRVFKIKK